MKLGPDPRNFASEDHQRLWRWTLAACALWTLVALLPYLRPPPGTTIRLYLPLAPERDLA